MSEDAPRRLWASPDGLVADENGNELGGWREAGAWEGVWPNHETDSASEAEFQAAVLEACELEKLAGPSM